VRRAIAALFAVAAAGAAPAAATSDSSLVTTFRHPAFGRVLARPDGQALYYWSVEKRDRFRIHCTGSCAKLWPPLIVRRGGTVAATRRGFSGRFGVVRRPDGRRQLTYNRLPLYTYVHEGPRQVLCNDVDGWFVVKAGAK
jgi:predicted lipoprotein with Yx(FWY)xxD motif